MERPFIKTTAITLLTAVNLLMAAFTIISAYGGAVSPYRFHAVMSIAAMTFPVWVIILAVLIVFDLFTKRITVLIPAATVLLCIGPFWNFCPLNVIPVSPAPSDSTFTILTYNVYKFWDYQTGEALDPDDESPTVKTIIDKSATFTCLQEGYAPRSNIARGISAKQTAEIDSIYPYMTSNVHSFQSFLSKVPFTEVSLPSLESASAEWSCYKTSIYGVPLTIYNIHLQSIGLDDDDKELFLEITDGHARHNIKKAKHQLLSKLAEAFRNRASQAQIIRTTLDADTSRNVIICGDFNDIPDCYAIRTICGDDFHNAYTRRGIGPGITYRANRFYFHIDQILYRGDIEPTEITTVRAGASDHYPVFATFRLKHD